MSDAGPSATADDRPEDRPRAGLALRGIERRFPGGRGLSGVDLDVGAGEMVALIGPSGAGKSTLLRIVAGLEDADRGLVLLDGRDLRGRGPAERRVAMTLDDAALYEHLTVEANLFAGLDRFGLRGEEARRAVREAAELVGAVDLLGRETTRLSAGERRRVGLARAVARRPAILLLDEPLTHLDHRTRIDLREDLRRVHASIGAATLLVTHDHADAIAIADRLAYLDGGRVLQTGDAESFRTPEHVDVARGASWTGLNVLSVTDVGGRRESVAFPIDAVRTHDEGTDGESPSDVRMTATVTFRTDSGPQGIVLTLQLADGQRIRMLKSAPPGQSGQRPSDPSETGQARDSSETGQAQSSSRQIGQALRVVVPAASVIRFDQDGRRTQ